MALLNISASARAVGKDRNTIKRYLSDGRLSSSKDASGKTVIDTSELVRVFGALKTDGTTDTFTSTDAESQPTTAELVIAAASIESLQKQLDAALEREKWMQKELEEAREHNRELERRMLPPGEEPGVKKGFFRRLFG